MLTTIYENPKKIFYPYSRRMQGELTTPWLVVYGYTDSITAYPWMLVFTHLAFRKKQQVATKKREGRG